MNKAHFKSLVITQIVLDVNEKIHLSKGQISSIHNSKSSATKSTAGDKHETGRAMMERELAMAEFQLQKAMQQKADIENLQNASLVDGEVRFGSLIHTTNGYFLLGIGFGKVETDGAMCFAISSASPIGIALSGKKVGDVIEFNSSKIEILSIT